MVSTVDKLSGFVLSANEVKELTGWDDAMTEDYLNILRNIVNIAQDVDVDGLNAGKLFQYTAGNKTQISNLRAQLSKIQNDANNFKISTTAELKKIEQLSVKRRIHGY